jgi:spore germination protein YaaH
MRQRTQQLISILAEATRRPQGIALAIALGVLLGVSLIVRWGAASVEPKLAATEAAKPLAKAQERVAEQPKPRTATATRLNAFYANFDEAGLASLERNAEQIDVLIPMWYHLGSDGQITFDASHADRVNAIIAAKNPDMKVMPIINNYDKAAEAWNAPQVAALIADPTQRAVIAQRIVDTMVAAGYDGVNVDFESFTAADRANLVAFMAELYPRAHAAGLEVSMDVIVGSQTYDHAALSQQVDYLVPMMYDEHWKTSPAGPISSVPWFASTLDRFLQQVPAEKVMVGLGTYSYDWSGAGGRARSLTYAAAMAIAAQQGMPSVLGADTGNSSFSYTGADGAPHAVWMLDAMSAFNQLQVAKTRGVAGYAVWRLGAEDPALWQVLPNRDALDRTVAESLNASGRIVSYDDATRLIVGAETRN